MDKIPIQLNVVMTSVSIGSEICIKIKRRRDWFSFLALSLSLSLFGFLCRFRDSSEIVPRGFFETPNMGRVCSTPVTPYIELLIELSIKR